MIKKLVKFTRYMLLIGLLLAPRAMFAMGRGGGGGQSDPLSRMDYDYAFNPDRFKDFKGLIEHWECTDNVFRHISDETTAPIGYDEPEEAENAESTGCLQTCRSSIASRVCCAGRYAAYSRVPTEQAEPEQAAPDYAQQEKEFRSACLNRLKRARYYSALSPAVKDIVAAGCIGGAACCVMKNQESREKPGNQTMGGGIAEVNCIFNMAFLAKDIMETLVTCWWPPVNVLEKLEERFALEQCFIPQEIWPRIIEQFKQARANPFSQLEAIRSIERLLVDRFKPKRAVSMHEDSVVDVGAEDILDRSHEGILLRRIDTMLKEFCAQYEPMDDMEYSQLANGIENFVNKVMYNRGKVKPLFLVGPWGVGKTHFFAVLQKWFDELLPGAIYIDQPKIHSPEQLAGSSKEPGLFLDTLRKQVRTRSKRGSLIFLDEAMWLNSQITDSAKLTFSDEQFSDLVAEFLGTASDVSLEMPPVLFLIASNDKITDVNLRSSFGIIINFPNPKTEALVDYAKSFVQKEPIGAIVRTADVEKRAAIDQAMKDYTMNGPADEQNFRAAERAEVLVTGILLGRVPLPPVTPSSEEVRRLGFEAAQRRLNLSAPTPVRMMDDGVGAGAKLGAAKKIE